MPRKRPLPAPDRLFDRTWRPGRPFRPRVSLSRRWAMLCCFVFLSAIIGTYWYITDSNRVRQKAQSYLSDLIGGRVEISKATLSIFEGFRLDGVRIYADADAKTSEQRPDSEIFSAATFKIDYSPRALLGGRIEATHIIAIDPHVRLTEDPLTHRWNYARLQARARRTTRAMAAAPPALPQISLRNAQVDYSQLRPDGSFESQGSIKIEGMLSPVLGSADLYRFKVQSRGGKSETLGPEVSGTIDLAAKTINASLYHFEFGRDIQAMLPAQVRTWWEEHGLAGNVDVPELSCSIPAEGMPFRVKVVLEGVTLTVQPEELMGREDIERRRWAASAFDVMRLAGMNHSGFVDQLASAVVPSPMALSKVTGDFIFDERGIDIEHFSAYVEDNKINVSGHYDGYSPDAPASLKLTAGELGIFSIPPSPRYLSSMPSNVREVYDHFKPQGSGSVWVRYNRPTAGARPEVTGELSITDGGFQFDKFPYPLRKARGKISLERDETTGEELVRLVHIRGHGLPGGPNEKADVEIDGVVGPFHPELAVHVTVRGEHVSSEPALTAAFPEQTRKALTVFDAEGKGRYPQFRGAFTTTIIRLPQVTSAWNIETDIHLDDAAGALVVFPYFMQGVTGDLRVLEDHVEIMNATMKRGDSSLTMNGRVDWGRDPTAEEKALGTRRPTLRPSLTFAARNVPIDRELLEALPESQRVWLQKLGVAGRFDLDGTVHTEPPVKPGASTEVGFAFDVSLLNCAISPAFADPQPSAGQSAAPVRAATPALTNVTGKLRLTPQRVIFSDLSGKRGDAEITARGSVSWPTMPPQIALIADAKNLALDQSLYQLLPEAAKKGWDQVAPKGSIDARITYSGAPAQNDQKLASPAQSPAVGASETAVASAAESVTPSTAPSSSAAYELVLTPRKLSATPAAAPYRLDDLAGTLTITPDEVVMRGITANHGDARIKLSGSGRNDSHGQWTWAFELSSQHMLVDDDLKCAVPASVASLIQSSQIQGKVGVEFSKLQVAPAKGNPTTAPTTAGSSGSSVDVDFAVRLTAEDAWMNVGVPLAHVNGFADLSGANRGGTLTEFSGQLGATSLTLADRSLTDFHAELNKMPEMDAMQLTKVQAKLAGGDLAGRIDWTTPDTGPGRYALSIVLRNADVRELTGENSAVNGKRNDPSDDIRGQMSASVALEGVFDNPSSRRGRGDVIVDGQQLYKIPLILGLLQVTNLALPITSPFNEATCRYSVDGGRVTFENIELRAKEMLMQGSGHLDFDTKKVRMTFVTQNDTWPKLPVIGDLLQGARNELLQIHVRGTITEPQVSASAMNTLTTTVDEVFKGSNPPPESPAPKQKKQK